MQCKQYRMGFLRFFSNNKNFFLLTKPKKRIKKTKNLGGLFFSEKNLFLNPDYFSIFLWFSFDWMIWSKSRHYQFDWASAAHLQYMSLVLKKLGITGIWIRKHGVDNKTSFEELNPCSMR